MKKLLSTLKGIIKIFIIYMPGPLGFDLRARFWKKRLKSMGRSVRIDVGVYFQHPEYISLGDCCWIDRNVMILAGPPGGSRATYVKDNPDYKLERGEVFIGKRTHICPGVILSGMGGLFVGEDCGIAAGSKIYSFSHHYRNLADKSDTGQYTLTSYAPPSKQAMILGPIVIDDYCAVGLNGIVLPGTTIKKGTWVASGAVVSKSYPEQSLIYFERHEKVKSLKHLTIKD